MKFSHIPIFILLIAVSSMLYSCNPVLISNSDLLSGKPCGAPCFWNLRPGINTYDDVVNTLDKNNFSSYCHTIESDRNGLIYIDCQKQIDISIYQNTKIIRSITLLPDDIHLEDIIDAIGEPDWVAVYETRSEAYPKHIVMALFFDDIMTQINLPAVGSNHYPAENSNLVTSVCNMDNDTYQQRNRFYDFSIWAGYGYYDITEELEVSP